MGAPLGTLWGKLCQLLTIFAEFFTRPHPSISCAICMALDFNLNRFPTIFAVFHSELLSFWNIGGLYIFDVWVFDSQIYIRYLEECHVPYYFGCDSFSIDNPKIGKFCVLHSCMFLCTCSWIACWFKFQSIDGDFDPTYRSHQSFR